MNGSWLGTGRTIEIIASKQPDWSTWRIYLTTNHRLFDVEHYAIGDALNIAISDARMD